jgi:hypothetical protein
MKKIKILLISVLLLLPIYAASASFGISPTYFYNEEMYPGEEYEKIINLLRSDNAPLESARIEFAVNEANGWFSVNEKNPIILPKGTVRKSIIVKVKVPQNTKPGTYSGKINIFLSGGSLPGINVVLGVSIKANIKVLDRTALGSILLQVEKKGEAWYINPQDRKKYFLGNPASAFNIMKKFAIGASHSFLTENTRFSSNHLGKIYLDTEDHGKAYYIDIWDKKAYYLGRPQDAFLVMTERGQGATDENLEKFKTGSMGP